MRGESLLDWALKETTADVKKVGSTVADSSYSNTAPSLSPLAPVLCPFSLIPFSTHATHQSSAENRGKN
jgi:hypothetical protein